MKKLIMIVDDAENLRESMRLVLEKNGYDVLEAVNTDDALRKLRLKKPDLILLDILMYGTLSSGEFVYNLWSSKKYTSIKIIYVSAVESLGKLHMRKNVFGVIEKPFKNEELISKIKNALKKKKREKSKIKGRRKIHFEDKKNKGG